MNRRTALITVMIGLTAVLFSIATPAKIRAVRGEGLMAVVHDTTLVGDGTYLQPLGVRAGQFVTTINGRTGPVNIAGGQGIAVAPSADGLFISATGSSAGVSALNGLTGILNIQGNGGTTVSTAGSTITVSSPANSGGLALPFNQSVALSGAAFTIANSSGPALIGRTRDVTNTASSAIIGFNDALGGIGFLGAGVAGVAGTSTASSGFGVVGSNSSSGVGVVGSSVSGAGVYGRADGGTTATGLTGACTGCVGVYGTNNGSSAGFAALFSGNVAVLGTVTKSAGSFKIDHPLDPETKYLSHSFVESPDMKNMYDGVIVLDRNGEAVVRLPVWFESLNRDFRYQLTCVGGYAPVYIASEVSGNEFRIGGGRSGLRVSWQLTGIRHDRYADAHRIQVEEMKDAADQGKYLHPELYGRDRRDGVAYRELPDAGNLKQQKEQQ